MGTEGWRRERHAALPQRDGAAAHRDLRLCLGNRSHARSPPRPSKGVPGERRQGGPTGQSLARARDFRRDPTGERARRGYGGCGGVRAAVASFPRAPRTPVRRVAARRLPAAQDAPAGALRLALARQGGGWWLGWAVSRRAQRMTAETVASVTGCPLSRTVPAATRVTK